jgi:hypothetical protein
MSKFTDTEGDVWIVNLDLPLSRELSRVTPYDIMNPNDYTDLMGSFGARLEMLWYVVRPQGAEFGVEDFRAFEKRLHGGSGVVYAASDAFCKACIDFFQRLGLDPMVSIAETYLEMGQKLVAKTQTEEFRRELAGDKKRMGQILGVDAGGHPDSTPTKDRRERKKDERKRRRRGR